MSEKEKVEIAGVVFHRGGDRAWRDANYQLMTDTARFPASEALTELAALRERVRVLEEALRGVAEGKGRFSMDHLEHAQNTIEDMKAIAIDALAASQEVDDGK